MPVNEVNGFAGNGIGEVFLLPYRLTSAYDRIVGIVVGLVTQVGGVDYLAKSSDSCSTARKYFPS